MTGSAVDAKISESDGPAESGAARARRVLIAPLLGLARPRGLTDAAHRDNLDRLARKLSYMPEPVLAALAELCLGHAGVIAGAALSRARVAAPVCPLDGTILAWGYALCAPPVGQSDYANSIMRAPMGRRARDAGYGVELLRSARRYGPPPGAYLVTKMQDEARENARRRAALRAEAEAGNSLDPVQARWLAAWHADAETVDRLIADGDARRAAAGDVAGDAGAGAAA